MEYNELIRTIELLEEYIKKMSKNGRNLKEIEEAKLSLKSLKRISFSFAINEKKILQIKSKKQNGTYWEVIDSTNQQSYF